jgi:hypothetical protein
MATSRAPHVAAALVAVVVAAGVAWLINAPPAGRDRADTTATPEVPKVPLLAVEPVVLEMGELVPRQPVTRTVMLRNLTDRALRVTSAIASCGCTTSTWPTMPIPPGGTTEAQVTMEAGDSQGEPLVKQVNYLPEGGLPVMLTVRGMVGTFVSCEPRMLDEPGPGEPGQPSEVVVESLDGTPFRIDAVDPDVAILPASDAPASRQVVQIDWARWRAAGRPIYLVIEVDHPKAPKLGVVVRRAIMR